MTTITTRENVSHYYLFGMGGSLTVITKFIPAHPFTEEHLESQIPSNLNVEDNGQPYLYEEQLLLKITKNQFHTGKEAVEQDINAQDQFILASSLER